MTNEELLEQLLEEVRRLRYDVGRLRSTIDSQSETIEELRTYIGNNIGNNSDNEKINIDEPKSIVISNQPKLSDENFYGNDNKNYYRNLDKKVVEEYLNVKKENDNKDIATEDEKEDNLNEDKKYIPGTNILKPEDRKPYQTDEEYVKYLEDYYKEHFPNQPKGLMTINNNEPKGLAILDDVKKTEEIEKLESAINDMSNKVVNTTSTDVSKTESRDIYSDSSIKEKIEKEKINNQKKASDSDDKSEVIEFASEEEKEAFEKGQSIDYKKDKDSKTKKVSKMRKAARKFKEVFKKHGKKIIAGVLVAATTIGAAMSIKACTYDKKDELNDKKDNNKSNSDEYEGIIPSVTVANDFGVSSDEVINKIDSKEKIENSITIDDELDVKKNEDFKVENTTYDLESFNIGEPVKFKGDYIYRTAADSVNDTNRFIPDNPRTDAREISAIEYVSPNGKQHMTAINEKEQKQLEGMGWKAESYNMKNNTRSSDTYELKYEGWVEPNDLTEVKSK